MPPQRQAAFPSRREQTARHGQIGLGNLARSKGAGQLQPGRLGQRHDQQSGRILVQTMNDARAQTLQTSQLRHTGKQAMHQRALRATGAGMHRQMRRLVHHRHVFIPVQDIQLARFRFQYGLTAGHAEGQIHARLQTQIRIDAQPAVHQAATFLHGFLDFRSGKPEFRAQKRVKPPSPPFGADIQPYGVISAGGKAKAHAAGRGVMT